MDGRQVHAQTSNGISKIPQMKLSDDRESVCPGGQEGLGEGDGVREASSPQASLRPPAQEGGPPGAHRQQETTLF